MRQKVSLSHFQLGFCYVFGRFHLLKSKRQFFLPSLFFFSRVFHLLYFHLLLNLSTTQSASLPRSKESGMGKRAVPHRRVPVCSKIKPAVWHFSLMQNCVHNVCLSVWGWKLDLIGLVPFLGSCKQGMSTMLSLTFSERWHHPSSKIKGTSKICHGDLGNDSFSANISFKCRNLSPRTRLSLV